MKKRIQVFHSELAPYRVDFFNKLASCYDVRVCFLYRNVVSQSFNQSWLQSLLHVKNTYLVNGFKIFSRPVRFGLLKSIRSFSPQVVVSIEFSLQTIWCCLLKPFFGFKCVSMVDDSPAMASKQGRKEKFLKPVVLRALDGLIVCSEATKRVYVQRYGFSTDKICVAPIVYDQTRLRTVYRNSLPIAQRYVRQFDLQDKKVIMYVGRLAKVKNLDVLLEAFARCDLPATVLILVGDGEEKPHLLNLCRALGIGERARVVGRYEADELYAWYLLAGVFVLPSTFEPFGAVVGEALVAGAPCLVSDLAGSIELVSNTQQGASFPPGDINVLAGLMRKYILGASALDQNNVQLRNSLLSVDLSENIDRIRGLVEKLTA